MLYYKMNLLMCTGIASLLFMGISANENLIISLKDGLIEGYYRESYDGRQFMAFEGIPYARPPIGNLRFEDPQPVNPWTGILKTVTSYSCVQFDPILFNGVGGQEDCLYINVYLPRSKINPDEKLDVVAHIHGGAFMMGSPDIAGPDKIMDRDVIYVNFNYRVGVFGFYSIGDGRGNYGMKDQSAALQWIQDNIEKFGGNKDSVTIVGMSAGGASVHLHYFSKLSRGLFHKGFAQSGMALNPWVVTANPAINGMRLASEVGCSDLASGNDIYECMRQRTAQQLTTAMLTLYEYSFLPLAPFAPIIEDDSTSSFLSKAPYLQLVDKEMTDVPLLVSMTTEEGTVPAAATYSQIEQLNENWKKLFPILFEYYEYNQGKRDEISERIREFYFNNEPITTENYGILIKACSHRMFQLGGEKAARLQAQASQSNVYFLLENYVGEFVPFVNISGFDVNFGAGHGTDIKFYYSGGNLRELKLNTDEERMKNILLDIMVSFAKTGNPNTDAVNVEPVSKAEELTYLYVKDPDNLHMEAGSLGPHEFWSSLGLIEDENMLT